MCFWKDKTDGQMDKLISVYPNNLVAGGIIIMADICSTVSCIQNLIQIFKSKQGS